MKKYKCIETFKVKDYDNDFSPKELTIKIEKDTIWKLKPNISYIGGELHLEQETDDCEYWIEISKERLEKYFIEVQDESME